MNTLGGKRSASLSRAVARCEIPRAWAVSLSRNVCGSRETPLRKGTSGEERERKRDVRERIARMVLGTNGINCPSYGEEKQGRDLGREHQQTQSLRTGGSLAC